METGTSAELASLCEKLQLPGDHLKNACCDELKVLRDLIKAGGGPRGKEVTLSGSGT